MKRHTHVILMIAVAIAFASLATSALAQNFRLIHPTGGGVSRAPHVTPPFTHWDLREFPDCKVPWVIGANPVPDLNGNGTDNDAADRGIFLGACTNGFNTWDAVVPSELNFTNAFAGGLPAGGFVTDGWNTLSWSSGALGAATNAATLLVRSAATGRITEVDIVFNSLVAVPGFGSRLWVNKPHGAACDGDLDYPPTGNWPTAVDGDTDVNGNGTQEFEVDLETEATHEIGHFIGLDHIAPLGGAHNNAANSIMEQFWLLGTGPTGCGWANHTLKDPDNDGDNYLYCPDLGDAPDPWMGVFNLYPTLVHDPMKGRTLNGLKLDAVALGAEHLFGIKRRQPLRNWTYEWLARFPGGNVDSECEANIVDKDPFDDGVTWAPNPPIWKRTLRVFEWVRFAADNVGNSHNYPVTPMYANAWMDINQDCIFAEHFMDVPLNPAPPITPNTDSLIVASGSIFLPLPPDPTMPVWLRARLDWGEDVGAAGNIDGTLAGPAGAAQHGEVEDYPFFCHTRYEQMWFCNPYPFTFDGFSMVTVGPSDPSDQTYSAIVNENDCPLQINLPPSLNFDLISDETTGWFPVPGIPPFTYVHFGWCRPTYPPLLPPLTVVRTHLTDLTVPCGTPPGSVPPALRVPTVNSSFRVYGPGDAHYGSILFTVGAVDFNSGGWIQGPGPGHTWSDQLQVTVSYRVSPDLIPLQSLSPCDPVYQLLPLHPVGTGTVNPEDPFEFMLDTPADVPSGSYVILEVTSSMSQSQVVNHQIIEFTDKMGTTTAVTDGQTPSRLALENYPNPFNPVTTIRYSLPNAADVSLAVYDVSGRLVRTLVKNAKTPAGVFEAEWNGTDSAGNPVASGVYFYRLTAGTEVLTRKAVLLK